MNEREFLKDIASATPEKLMELVLRADERQEQVLRIYLGDGQFESIRANAAAAHETRAVSAPKGNVVVLHGIMGGELAEVDGGGQDVIWVQVLSLISGKFDRLALRADGSSVNNIQPVGLYMRFYGSLLTSLAKDWTARGFGYDWRLDIRKSADALRQMIDTAFGPDAPVHLVAHSMGGLVARSYIKRHPDRWAKGGRLVMLGTPNQGSFAVPRLLLGTNDVLKIVNLIDLVHDRSQILDIVKTFTGAYDMMPAKGRIPGLEPLFQQSTYNVTAVDQSLLDEASAFANEIKAVIDPERMTYIAGYNKPTAAAIKDVTRLATDDGYVLSLKGDGTVPHDLGLLDGVRTFYVDEEHMKLPSNVRVQNSLTEILLTGDLQTEANLFKGLGPEFDNQRGDETAASAVLAAAEAARITAKEQQAVQLRELLRTRGAEGTGFVSNEEMALADLLLLRDASPVPMAAMPAGKAMAVAAGVGGGPGAGSAPASSPVPTQQAAASTRPSIRLHVTGTLLQDLTPSAVADAARIDCLAVGHYLQVSPGGGERALDRAISKSLFPETPPAPATGADQGGDEDRDLILQQLHERGLLRGDLGSPFFLPDPRPGHENTLIAVMGMGQMGEFGIPELTVVVRDLAWALAQLGKKHLATVLIGAGGKNLSIADVVHAFLAGLGRALTSATADGARRLEAVTFSVLPELRDAVISALWREKDTPELLSLDLDLADPRPAKPVTTPQSSYSTPVRISVEFEGDTCRYSAMTENASIAERVFRINPKRIEDINARLLSASDPLEKYKLGRFLLDFLFPRDLRSQLTGGAPVVLMCNNNAARVYWELAAQPVGDEELTSEPAHRDLAGQGAPYLGLQRGLTRQLRTVIAPAPEPPPPTGRVLRVLVVANPCRENQLPGAEAEARQLLDLLQGINDLDSGNSIEVTSLIGPRQATTLDVLLRINDQPPFDVLHYAGHCVLDEKNPERSGFLFSGDDRLTASDLDRVDRTPKFVFANACQSGVLPSRTDLVNPSLPAAFAEAFFKKGVANFICTAWPVGDKAAAAFALELYGRLLGAQGPPAPMFEALRSARAKIATTPTWGAYQHYGDPSFRLFRTVRAAGGRGPDA